VKVNVNVNAQKAEPSSVQVKSSPLMRKSSKRSKWL